MSALHLAYAALTPILRWHPRSTYVATADITRMDAWSLCGLRVRAVRAGLPVDEIDTQLVLRHAEYEARMAAVVAAEIASVRARRMV
jgi:hypothetical protein